MMGSAESMLFHCDPSDEDLSPGTPTAPDPSDEDLSLGTPTAPDPSDEDLSLGTPTAAIARRSWMSLAINVAKSQPNPNQKKKFTVAITDRRNACTVPTMMAAMSPGTTSAK